MNNTTKVGLMAAMMVLGLVAFSGSANAEYIKYTVGGGGGEDPICAVGQSVCYCENPTSYRCEGTNGQGSDCTAAVGADRYHMVGIMCGSIIT